MAEIVGLILRLQEKRRFVADAKDASKATRGIGDAADRAGKTAQVAEGKTRRYGTALRVLRGAAYAGAAALGVGVARGAFVATKNASALAEQINKTSAVFGPSGKRIQAWARTTADTIGISNRAALQATGVFGNMLVPMGIGRRKAADMSRGMVTLAADMASFNDASPEEVLDALRAGLAGESEPLRRYGVFLNDTRLKQEAMRQGLYSGTGALDAQAKAFATHGLILTDTADAQGDFNDTRDAAANAERRARANIEDLSAAIGRRLLPTYRSALGVTNRFIAGMNSGRGAGGRFANVLRQVAEEGGPLARQIGSALVPAGAGLLAVTSSLGGPLTLLGKLLQLAGEHGDATKVVVIALTAAFVAHRTATLASMAATKVHTAAQVLQANWTFIQSARSRGLRTALLAQAITQGRATIASRIATGAIKAQIIAQRALNLAMRMNPIGLAITALFALGIGLVAAYKKFAWFRNLVQGTWRWIKANWPLLLGILTGPIGLAVVAITRYWSEIKAGAKRAFDWIASKVQAVWEAIPEPIKRLLGGGPAGPTPEQINAYGRRVRATVGPAGPNPFAGSAAFQAEGGVTRRPGLSWVGERGPELLTLPRGARVDPLPAGPHEIVIHNYMVVDGKIAARSINRQVVREAALA